WTPEEFVCSWALAPLMSVPETSAGPRMYFVPPSLEQVTNGLFGSSVLVWNLFRSVQVSASNWAWITGVTQFGSLASVGLAVGVVAVGVEEAVAEPEGVGAAASAFGMARPAVDAVAEPPEVAVAPVVAVADDDAVEPAVEVPVAVAVGVAAAPAAASWMTARKRSWAEVLTRFLVAWLGVPGRSTTMFLPPW